MCSVDFELIRQAFRRGDYELSVHALQMMDSRGLREADLRNVVISGEIIERDPDAKPYPKCIFLGETLVKGESLHVVCSWRPGAVVVTAYFPDEDRWARDRIRRR